MLKRILDTTKIDMDDPDVCYGLETDLRRMDHMKHQEAPEGADAYKVTVEPSIRTYYPGMYRFRFFIQYGKLEDDKLIPMGETIRKQTETLPYI